MRAALVRGAILAIALAFLSACTPVESGRLASGRHPWTHPGVLRIASNADPKNLDPILAAASPVLELSTFLFSYTVRYDERARPVPDAVERIPTVENGDVARDGLTIRYRLRHNMKWHDGEPVTCRDLRFTWQAVMNPHNNVVTTDGYKDIHDIDCHDPYVAVVHMSRVYAPFLQQLWSLNGNAPILPEHLLARYNDDRGSFNTAPYHAAPIGSGPFTFVSWNRGTDVHFAAFDGYYLGKPKLREVIYRILPDENTMLTQLQTHDVDLIFHGGGMLWERAHKLPGTMALDPTIFAYMHVDFNLRRPIFADRRVREALALAIDRPAILAKVDRGLGELADADQSPSIGPAYTAQVPHDPYDPARARALLDAAGWRRGADGIRQKSGVRMAFSIGTPTENTIGKAIEQLLIGWWHDVGIEVSVKNAPTSLFYDNTANGILQGGKYDAAVFAWSAAADPDDSAIYSRDNFAPHGQNALFWDDAIASDAMRDALATVDWSRRKADYAIVQRRLAGEVPTIILFFERDPVIFNDDLHGMRPTPVITTPFWNTWEYSI
jgi:peptide/nickel transport system substrate-binding protein